MDFGTFWCDCIIKQEDEELFLDTHISTRMSNSQLKRYYALSKDKNMGGSYCFDSMLGSKETDKYDIEVFNRFKKVDFLDYGIREQSDFSFNSNDKHIDIIKKRSRELLEILNDKRSKTPVKELYEDQYFLYISKIYADSVTEMKIYQYNKLIEAK